MSAISFAFQYCIRRKQTKTPVRMFSYRWHRNDPNAPHSNVNIAFTSTSLPQLRHTAHQRCSEWLQYILNSNKLCWSRMKENRVQAEIIISKVAAQLTCSRCLPSFENINDVCPPIITLQRCQSLHSPLDRILIELFVWRIP